MYGIEGVVGPLEMAPGWVLVSVSPDGWIPSPAKTAIQTRMYWLWRKNMEFSPFGS
jgi:hypothetical protein